MGSGIMHAAACIFISVVPMEECCVQGTNHHADIGGLAGRGNTIDRHPWQERQKTPMRALKIGKNNCLSLVRTS